MIHFEWLWALLALPLPLLVRWAVPPELPEDQAALKTPFFEDFTSAKTKSVISNKQWPLILAIIAWILLIIASSRPQWMGEPIEQAISGRDLMLAIDLSGSMDEQDFIVNKRRVNRLTATKKVAGEFISRRAGDRLGLILFGTQAYLQTPLTFDRATVMTLLNESALGLAGKNTAIGDAIGLAVKRLKKQSSESKVLVLLTDGANTAGEVTPLKAAELAAEYDLKIYTIGIGADEMIVRSFFGNRKVNPSRDLDETTLKAIAEKTGGRYFRARDTDELNQIYNLLDDLEPIEKDKQFFRPKTELYYWPLAIALLLSGLISISRLRWL
ncbi:MAG: VWA domain-containing protein [Methylococcales bacterium]|nr:VWA domain-containing protein [Methylococcales bacterium]